MWSGTRDFPAPAGISNNMTRIGSYNKTDPGSYYSKQSELRNSGSRTTLLLITIENQNNDLGFAKKSVQLILAQIWHLIEIYKFLKKYWAARCFKVLQNKACLALNWTNFDFSSFDLLISRQRQNNLFF